MDRPYIIFDFDGVLVDSAEYVRDAYVSAGCRPPTNILDQAHGQWHSLTCTHPCDPETIEQLYALKNLAYLQRLRDEPELEWSAGMYAAFQIWCADRDVRLGVYSAAPSDTLRVVRERWGWNRWPFKFAIDDIRTAKKMKAIRSLRCDFDIPGVYVDDQDRDIDLPDDWRFVHYTGQDVDTLVKEILE